MTLQVAYPFNYMKFQTQVQEQPNHSVLTIIIMSLYKQQSIRTEWAGKLLKLSPSCGPKL